MSTRSISRLDRLAVFPSELGWMAMAGSGAVLRGLTFGYSTPEQAIAALGLRSGEYLEPRDWNRPLMRQLQAFASGERVDFGTVQIDLGGLTAFRRKVVRICRKIPYGKTLTYGQVAARAGSPGAARAVGACMATNRIPLVVPCHRVVAEGGGLGGFSAPGGIAMKRRLLAMEAGPRASVLQMG